MGFDRYKLVRGLVDCVLKNGATYSGLRDGLREELNNLEETNKNNPHFYIFGGDSHIHLKKLFIKELVKRKTPNGQKILVYTGNGILLGENRSYKQIDLDRYLDIYRERLAKQS